MGKSFLISSSLLLKHHWDRTQQTLSHSSGIMKTHVTSYAARDLVTVSNKTLHLTSKNTLVGICLFLQTGTHYVDQAGLELVILLPQPPRCWDYRCCQHAWLEKNCFKILVWSIEIWLPLGIDPNDIPWKFYVQLCSSHLCLYRKKARMAINTYGLNKKWWMH
jgi:hypothetical protein